MLHLRIPEEYRPGLEKLQRLGDETTQALLTMLRHEHPTLLYEDFLSQIASKVEGLQPEETRAIVDAVLSLYALRTYSELPIPELATSVSHSEDLDIPQAQRKSFESRLAEILDLEPLLITSKALGILNDYERSFHDARVLTDVRPIFTDDVVDRPGAAVIVHTLKITYHHADALEEFFVAFGASDLNRLQEALNRARSKANSLKSAVEAAGISCLDTV
jgi:hypothetical protein